MISYGVEQFTGIRPTSDLTVANYIGAVKPILDAETDGANTCIFLAELHAATTHRPSEVIANAQQLGRTLIASGVKGDIYSQRGIHDLVAEAEFAIRGLTSISRLLRLPTLKEKVTQSDDTATASVGLAMYPVMMAADIILARPEIVPTGRDQRPHLELTKELIRNFNREFGIELPEPRTPDANPPNILSLDASGRKMSKSYPKGAIFLDDDPDTGFRKIKKAVTASQPGPELDLVVDNMVAIVEGLADTPETVDYVKSMGAEVKDGNPTMGQFKASVGDVVSGFLTDMSKKRASVMDREVTDRIRQGTEEVRTVAEETYTYLNTAYWNA